MLKNADAMISLDMRACSNREVAAMTWRRFLSILARCSVEQSSTIFSGEDVDGDDLDEEPMFAVISH
jgi:hypothetical protein